MSFGAGQVDVFDRMAQLLSDASAPSNALVGEVATACRRRLPIRARAGKTGRIDEFVKTGAWLDAMFTLIKYELPQWTLRCLLYEDGEWHCCLSRQPNLPIEFDDAAHGHHAVLPLAVLMAFVEGCRRSEQETIAVNSTSDRRITESGIVMCCDNFR